MSLELTPKQQLQKEIRQTVLAKYQYENSFSVQEMNDEFERQKMSNTEKTSPTKTNVVYDSEKRSTNSALYVLSYLLPPRRKKK